MKNVIHLQQVAAIVKVIVTQIQVHNFSIINNLSILNRPHPSVTFTLNKQR